jgi:hypothetical protein
VSTLCCKGRFFFEFDLATITRDLDHKEKQMIMEGGMESVDYLQYMAEGSSNVSMDGNFNIQVINSDGYVDPLKGFNTSRGFTFLIRASYVKFKPTVIELYKFILTLARQVRVGFVPAPA